MFQINLLRQLSQVYEMETILKSLESQVLESQIVALYKVLNFVSQAVRGILEIESRNIDSESLITR